MGLVVHVTVLLRYFNIDNESKSVSVNCVTSKSYPGVSSLAQKWVTFAPNGTNPGLFHIRFQYILARRAKMY